MDQSRTSRFFALRPVVRRSWALAVIAVSVAVVAGPSAAAITPVVVQEGPGLDWGITAGDGYIAWSKNTIASPNHFDTYAKQYPGGTPFKVNGDVSGYWAVWDECPVRNGAYVNCNVYSYDILGKVKSKVPNPVKFQYSPSVTSDGTVYYVRSGGSCGAGVRFMRYTPAVGSVVFATVPRGYDIDTLEAHTNTDTTTSLYFDRFSCRQYEEDIYKIDGLGISSLRGAGAGNTPAVTTEGVSRPDCTITGTSGDDTLHGTSGDDVICALGGDDIVRAGLGDDTVYLGAGDDSATLGGGNDIAWGQAGRDAIVGDAGDDRIYGQLGNDRWLKGGNEKGPGPLNGVDLMNGGQGHDCLWGWDMTGGDTLLGGPQNDAGGWDAGDTHRGVETRTNAHLYPRCA